MEFRDASSERQFTSFFNRKFASWDSVSLRLATVVTAKVTWKCLFTPGLHMVGMQFGLYTAMLSALLWARLRWTSWYLQHRTNLILGHKVLSASMFVLVSTAPVVLLKDFDGDRHTLWTITRLVLAGSHMFGIIHQPCLPSASASMVCFSTLTTAVVVISLPSTIFVFACEPKNLALFRSWHAAAPPWLLRLAGLYYGNSGPQGTTAFAFAAVHLLCFWLLPCLVTMVSERRLRQQWACGRSVEVAYGSMICAVLSMCSMVLDPTGVSAVSSQLVWLTKHVVLPAHGVVPDSCCHGEEHGM